MSTVLTTGRRELKVLGLIGSAHMLSHVQILLLPPLFPLLKEEFGVSYAALGVVAAAFSLAASLGQVPMGFLVDRIGGRNLLVAGLLLQGCAAFAMAFANSYWMLVALSAVTGLAATVFHPANFAILSASIPQGRLGRAFSMHSLCGNLGGALTPPVVIALTVLWDWRVAVAAAGVLSVMVAVLIAWQRGALAEERVENDDGSRRDDNVGQGIALLLSGPILMAFLFFLLSSIGVSAIQTLVVAAVASTHDTTLAAASGVLTGFLIGAATGIFIAGFLLDRNKRPDSIATVAFLCAAVLMVLAGSASMPIAMLTLLLTVTGVCSGIVQPTRDLMVRQITPTGATGKVFGFLSTAFSVGGVVTPVIFGWILDNAGARWMFWLIAAFMLASILTVIRVGQSRPVSTADGGGGDGSRGPP